MSSWPLERPVLSGHVPLLARAFVPRQESGSSAAQMRPGETMVLVPASGAAPAGTGKTHIAAAAARAHHQSGAGPLTIWITATSRDAVVAGYAQAVRDAGLAVAGGTAESAAAALLAWLKQASQPWLIVLDDLRDSAAEDLWPAGPAGQVIVTSREPAAARQAPRPTVVAVGAYSPREASAFLAARLRADPGQRTGAVDLAGELGLAPVALAQAAAVISETGTDCRQYRTRFAARLVPGAAPGVAPATGDHDPVLAATWSLAAEFADQLAPRGLAGRVLALASVLSAAGVPGAVLTSPPVCAYLSGFAGAGPVGEPQVRAALRNLARAGLAVLDPRSPSRTVAVHEVVQGLARRGLAGAQASRAAVAAADALAWAWSRPDVPPRVAQALRDCTAALRENAGAALWAPHCHPVLVRAGESMESGGLAGTAVSYWQALLAESEHRLGDSHAQTLAVRESLIRAYLAAGRPGDTVRLAEAALAERKRTLGARHPDTVAAQGGVARAYLRLGRLADATAAFERMVGDSERGLGYYHFDTIAARAVLAEVYREVGRVKDATLLCKRVLADRERKQGAGHPDTIAARASLAAVYRQGRKSREAKVLYRQVLADAGRVLGPEHPLTVAARQALAGGDS